MGTMMLDPRPTLADSERSVAFGWSAIRLVSSGFARLTKSIEAAQLRHHTAMTLSALDDRLLRDIGLHRDAIAQVASKATSQMAEGDTTQTTRLAA